MDAEVFARISRRVVDDYRKDLFSQNIELLESYLSNIIHSNDRLSSSMNNNDRSVK